MNILVSGAMGFIGSYTTKALQVSGHEVVTIKRDHVRRGTAERLRLDVTTVYGDLLDFQKVKRTIHDYDIDVVVHMAAESLVKNALDQPAAVLQNNIQSTINLLEAARLKNVKHFLYFSTDKALGEVPIPTIEDTVPQPKSPYDVSKYASEVVTKCYSDTYGLNTIITRSCNVFAAYDLAKRIIPNTIRQCLRGESPTIRNGVTMQREYIYVDDVTSAVQHILNKKLTGLYHIGSCEVRNQEEVVNEILKHFPTLKPKYEDAPEYTTKEIGDQQLDSTKLRNTGWSSKVSFEEGIERTVRAEKQA